MAKAKRRTRVAIVYGGASAEVAVPNGPSFPRGTPVEVPEALAERLLEQAGFRRAAPVEDVEAAEAASPPDDVEVRRQADARWG
jgi:hypothetical protein